MSLFDDLSEHSARKVAQQTSRRGFLGRLGSLIVGGAAIPLLPVERASAASAAPAKTDSDNGYPGVASQAPVQPGEEGDPTSCDYWRYCGTGGPLCACCGGSANACPPGSEMSPLSWIGTCRNPADGKNYIISYNDCCGQPKCKRCQCSRNIPEDKPIIRPQASDQYLWCLGTKHSSFTCTVSVVIGLALDQE